MPQDVRISPDGKTWYVADMSSNGVYVIDGATFTQVDFLPTGVDFPRMVACTCRATRRSSTSRTAAR